MRYPIELKEKAIRFRKKGYSLKEISGKLKIAKSTSSGWLRDICLSKTALNRLKKRKIYGQYKAIQTGKRKRIARDAFYKKWAQNKLASILVNKNILRVFCSLLYWTEGAKFTDNCLKFTNSDPRMISTFLVLLRKGFDIKEKSLRVNIHLHSYHNDNKQKMFWSKVTKIPLSQFNKSYQKKNTHKRIRKNYAGCVRICYYCSDTARKIRAIYEELENYI